MHARLNLTSVILAVIAASFILLSGSNALAQTSDPDVTGHGTCQQAPDLEPSGDLCGFSLDTFFLDRASRLVAAATRWQPSSVTKFATISTLSMTRPTAIRVRALR